jgi:hypothetical protein
VNIIKRSEKVQRCFVNSHFIFNVVFNVKKLMSLIRHSFIVP